MDYKLLDDSRLVNLLYTEADRLPRAAVDEFILRGERMVPLLSEIVSKSYSWVTRLPDWWAVVHAVFILGAIGTKETILPLLKSLRYASAHGCDWVTNNLPSIFGKIGLNAMDGLKMIALDRTSDWFERAYAIDGLAAITISNPDTEEEIFRFVGSLFTNEQEDRDVREAAGNVLLDFKREEYKDALLAFGQEEDDLHSKDFFYTASFVKSDVIEAFGSGKKDLWHYTLNSLEFYDEKEIRKRQERWEREDRKRAERELKEEEELLHSGSPKVGRNAPCPCGSGKKYKKCCGAGQ